MIHINQLEDYNCEFVEVPGNTNIVKCKTCNESINATITIWDFDRFQDRLQEFLNIHKDCK